MKRFIMAIGVIALAAFLFCVPASAQVYVVCLHSISEVPPNPYDATVYMSPTYFENMIRGMKKDGTNFLTLEQFYAWLIKGIPVKEPSVLLTFDDGYLDNYTTVFPLLKKYEIPATIFLVAKGIDTNNHLTTEQIIEMKASGFVSFGSHTVTHANLEKTEPELARWEMETSRMIIEQKVGFPIFALAYPNGKNNEQIREMAKEAGYLFAFGTHSGPCARGTNTFNLHRYTPGGFRYIVKRAARPNS